MALKEYRNFSYQDMMNLKEMGLKEILEELKEIKKSQLRRDYVRDPKEGSEYSEFSYELRRQHIAIEKAIDLLEEFYPTVKEMTRYTMIITESEEEYGDETEGNLSNIVYGNSIEELMEYGDDEGLFYQIYENGEGKKIGEGLLSYETLKEDIQVFESNQ